MNLSEICGLVIAQARQAGLHILSGSIEWTAPSGKYVEIDLICQDADASWLQIKQTYVSTLIRLFRVESIAESEPVLDGSVWNFTIAIELRVPDFD